ncbi:methyltransferase-like protein-like protein 10 [Massarina eburnea CBS 473.64]|uniref:Protein-lysine N-methyltransferase EFM4 n=1 Tax=Massarina eburnea CBS 473.64 TaxID=1395130 RepID=A0A6A6RK67_9PLEO|nr:methyltransferase-like protein-like protein 10 [Massarina eburnea CBS 473.64]
MAHQTPTHLAPSSLGTRAYWDSAYTTERQNFAQNTDDEGTVWFSDAGAEERMCQFLEDLAEEGELVKGEESASGEDDEEGEQPTRFLDLGTGNGHLLFSLREDGWMGGLVGVDYSAQSIALAHEVLRNKNLAQRSCVSFYEYDILASTTSPPAWLAAGFDVVLDKGTFDAISLSAETDGNGHRICEGYREKVEGLVKQGGRFLITSCNWTEEELRGWFEGDESTLVYEDKVKYPSFRFGGKEGSSVCTLCFKRR